MPISCAVLMCHAPVVIPQIGALRHDAYASTTRAMRDAARALVTHEPQLAVLVTPRAPRSERSWGIVDDPELRGDFARLGHPAIELSAWGSPQAAHAIAHAAAGYGLQTHALSGDCLDQGALVPLYFMREAGYRGAVVVLSPPFPGAETEVLFGEVLREAARSSSERWAVLASGDLSHRATRNDPLGIHPHAQHFDAAFSEFVRAGDLRSAIGLDPDLSDSAAENLIQATAVAAGAIAFRARGLQVFSRNSQPGSAYLQALLYSERAEIRHLTPPRSLVQVARDAIEHELRGKVYHPPFLDPPWHDARAVFVTLRNADGVTRGAIGRTEPVHTTLAEEVADCAVAAATRDYRIPPVELDELDQLRIELSVLDDPEPVENRDELDPQRYGIVVTRGLRRGVLLPNIEGVESPADQLRMALRHGGIGPSEPYRLERFAVSHVAYERNSS